MSSSRRTSSFMNSCGLRPFASGRAVAGIQNNLDACGSRIGERKFSGHSCGRRSLKLPCLGFRIHLLKSFFDDEMAESRVVLSFLYHGRRVCFILGIDISPVSILSLPCLECRTRGLPISHRLTIPAPRLPHNFRNPQDAMADLV